MSDYRPPLPIRVHGLPAPQGSKRPVGAGRMVESSKALGPWREAVRAETQRALESGGESRPRGVAIAAYVAFYLPRPKGHYRANGELKPSAPDYPTTVPDVDKLLRAVFDGMAAGGAFENDSQIVQVYTSKDYATRDLLPGLVATLHDATALRS